jgi:hypothetical protein
MAIATKKSRKSNPAAKRSRSVRASRSEVAMLAQQVGQMNRILDKLVDAGLLAVAQSQRGRRTPLPEYAKVVAVGQDDEVQDVRGRTGVVLDVQKCEAGWTYTVYFPAKQETFVLHEESLWDTGENIPEDVIYGGGETRRVRVGADGNGRLVS